MMRMIKAMFRRQRTHYLQPDDGVFLRPFPAHFDLQQPSHRERIELEHRSEYMDEHERCDWKPRELEK